MRIGIRAPLALSIMIAMSCGCASHRKPAVAPAPTTRPVLRAQPILDVSRGGAGLPLEDSTVLELSEDLRDALTSAFQRRLVLAEDITPVTIVGDHLHNLDLLKIDISNATVREDFHPTQSKLAVHPVPALTVSRFEYLAAPVYYQKVASSWRMSASDVRFGLLRDGKGRQTLVLTDAREGSFEFSVLLNDLRKPRVLVTGSTTQRSPVSVRDVDVQFASDDPHSLTAQIQIRITFLFIPMSFRLRGRADIDPACNLRLSRLECEGMDPGGLMIASIIGRSMRKLDGQVLPLVRFPEDRVMLTDVRFHVDDSLRINATFAERPQK